MKWPASVDGTSRIASTILGGILRITSVAVIVLACCLGTIMSCSLRIIDDLVIRGVIVKKDDEEGDAKSLWFHKKSLVDL